MTFEEYRAIEAVNASAIVAGMKSMKHMHMTMTGESKPATPAMRWGTLVHSMVLEPDLSASKLSIFPGKTRRGKEWDAFCESHDEQWIVKEEEYAKLYGIKKAVMLVDEAREIIENTHHELTVTWDENGHDCKARLDGYSAKRGILELKTTGQIEPRRFMRTAADLAYHVRMGWYHRGIEIKEGISVPVTMVTVEADEPHDVVIYHLPPSVTEKSKTKAIETANKYWDCCAAEHWPGVADGVVLDYELPHWADAYAVDDIPEEEMDGSEL